MNDINNNYFQEEEEVLEGQRAKRLAAGLFKTGLVFLVLAGSLYFYGMHNAFFYSKTPMWVQQPQLESAVDNEELLRVPITAFILVNDETNGSQRSLDNVERMAENASYIWQQANIELYVEDIFTVEQSDQEISVMMSSPTRFARTFDDFNRDTINAFLVGRIEGINGIAFIGLNAISVADYTTSHDFRVFAHEVGHILGLPHVNDRSYLMYTGASGSELSLDEIRRARDAARRSF